MAAYLLRTSKHQAKIWSWPGTPYIWLGWHVLFGRQYPSNPLDQERRLCDWQHMFFSPVLRIASPSLSC